MYNRERGYKHLGYKVHSVGTWTRDSCGVYIPPASEYREIWKYMEERERMIIENALIRKEKGIPYKKWPL